MPITIKKVRAKIEGGAYNDERGYPNLEEEFRHDAMEAVGLNDHPNAAKIYHYAEREGHSSGWNEILNVLEDVADLIKLSDAPTVKPKERKR